MDFGHAQQEAIRRKRDVQSHYKPPPEDWTQQQCRLYLCILQKYLNAYDGAEAISRADACLDRVFRQWARKQGKGHKHRRGYLNQIRSFLRANVDVKAVKAAVNIDTIVDQYATHVCEHLAALPEIAEDAVYEQLDSAGTDAVDTVEELLQVIQNVRADWHQRRTTAQKSLRCATEARDFDVMKKSREQLDQAEQMCLYYGHVATRTERDVAYRHQRERMLTLEEATFGVDGDGNGNGKAHEKEMTVERMEKDQEANTKEEGAEEEEACLSIPEGGPFVTFLHADRALAPAEQYVMRTLAQYVDPSNPILHTFASSVEQIAFVESAARVPNSPILAVINDLNTGRPGRLQRVQRGMGALVSTLTSRLSDVPFIMLRGINDACGQIVREQNMGTFNNVCRSSIDADVLCGIGRPFTSEECETPENVRLLFCAEPGCFRIARYEKNPERAAFDSADRVVVRLHRPHITMSHTVLAPGCYVLDRTIYMPGIERGRAIGVRSHQLYEHQPMYATAEYNATQVEALVKAGQWQKAQELKPVRILHAGNTTLFLAATVSNREPLGFALAGSAGRCLIDVPSVHHRSQEQEEEQYRRCAYVEEDHDTYTQTVYKPQEHHDALYIDSLCGCTNIKARPRGVGYFLMAHTLAYHALAHPTGVMMRVRHGGSPVHSAIDASVAFYYYTHFGMQCATRDVARDVGFDALRQMYDVRETITKRELKQDGAYVHVRNVLSSVYASDGIDAPISLDLITGRTKGTAPYHFVHSPYTTSSRNARNLMYRPYPHVSELYDRIYAHYAMLNGGCASSESDGDSDGASLPNRSWTALDAEYSFAEQQRQRHHQHQQKGTLDSVSQSFGGWTQ